MRLYLSSYHIGDHAAELVRLVGSNRKVAHIVNASDWGTEEGRNIQLKKQIHNFDRLGFESEEVDLRKYFGKPNGLEKKLAEFGLVWLKGGNTFILKRAIEQSGFDKVILPILESDAIVFGGFSAGAIIASPTLKGVDLCDDPVTVPAGYQPGYSWDCLNLVSYSIVPHYQSNHPESYLMPAVVEYMERERRPYKKMQDGDVIVVENGRERFLHRKTKSTEFTVSQ